MITFPLSILNKLEATPGFEPGHDGFANRFLTAWICRLIYKALLSKAFGAGDEARTRYLHLGKVALYRMSYARIVWCLRSELNQRHADFQSAALPTELQRHTLGSEEPKNTWRPRTDSNRRPPA